MQEEEEEEKKCNGKLQDTNEKERERERVKGKTTQAEGRKQSEKSHKKRPTIDFHFSRRFYYFGVRGLTRGGSGGANESEEVCGGGAKG